MKTLYDLLDEYLEHLESLNYSPATISGKNYACTNFIKYLEGTFQLETASNLRKAHLCAWQKHFDSVRTRYGRPMQSCSINNNIGRVKSFLEFLALRGYILKTVLDVLGFLKVPTLLPGGVMTNEETKKLLRQPDKNTLLGYRDRTIMELMYSSGLRAGEVISMHTDSVDFKNRTVKVMGKGRKERMVPVGKTALRYLETYLKAVRPFQLIKGGRRAFFINRRGDPVQYISLMKMINKYRKTAKLDVHITTHSFRRSCATELIRGNANIYHVKEILGHESLETLKHYTKLTIMDLRKTHAKCHPREKNT
jgi:integrase/recombinase XerD